MQPGRQRQFPGVIVSGPAACKPKPKLTVLYSTPPALLPALTYQVDDPVALRRPDNAMSLPGSAPATPLTS
jgi:hypothetical protein